MVNKYDISNIIGDVFARNYDCTMLDHNNILWKIVDGVWLGKRSVYTYDLVASWLEDTTIDNVKIWWCGKEGDYNEIFYRKINKT